MADDKLIGDIAHNTIRKFGGDRMAHLYTKLTGKPCNCQQRKEHLNALHLKWREMQSRNQKKKQ